MKLSDWKFKGSFIDFSKYLKKNRLKASQPNRMVVAVCWLIVIIALIIAFLKIVFKVF